MAVSTYDKQYLTSGQQAEIDRVTQAAQSGQMSWSDAHTAAEAVRASGGYSGGATGGAYSPYSSTTATSASNSSNRSDLSGYLNDLYAAQTEANLASLKSAYDTNKSNLEAEGAKIAPTYQAQKNQAAVQSDQGRQSFNEVAAANGLNSGTTGQANIAQNVALQNNLNTLGTAQANAESENALALSNLASEYQSAIASAKATSNSSLESALYNEYVRQAEAATTAQQNAQSQANWEKEYQLSVDQNTASQASENKQYASSWVQYLLQSGTMPSASLLSAAGISTADAQNTVNAVKLATAAANAKSSSGSSKSSSGSTKPTLTAAQTLAAIDKGVLSDSVLAAYKYYYGVDYNNGKPQTPTESIVGSVGDSDFQYLKTAIAAQVETGNVKQAQATINRYWNSLSDLQKTNINSLMKKYGY